MSKIETYKKAKEEHTLLQNAIVDNSDSVRVSVVPAGAINTFYIDLPLGDVSKLNIARGRLGRFVKEALIACRSDILNTVIALSEADVDSKKAEAEAEARAVLREINNE